MSLRRSHPWLLWTGIVVVVVIAAAAGARLLKRGGDGDEQASVGYCLALHRPDETVAEIRGAIAGKPTTETSGLADLRARSSLFFTTKAADGAPKELEADAHRVIRAFRSAITERSDAPLDTPQVQASVRTLAARGDAICDGDAG